MEMQRSIGTVNERYDTIEKETGNHRLEEIPVAFMDVDPGLAPIG